MPIATSQQETSTLDVKRHNVGSPDWLVSPAIWSHTSTTQYIPSIDDYIESLQKSLYESLYQRLYERLYATLQAYLAPEAIFRQSWWKAGPHFPEPLAITLRPYAGSFDFTSDVGRVIHRFSEPGSSDTKIVSRPSLVPVAERLSQLLRLENNWDSYGAEPISPNSVATAMQLVATVYESLSDLLGDQVRPFAIAPIPDGGLQLEWRSPKGALEIEVNPDGTLGYLLVLGEEPNRKFEEADDIPWTLVSALLGRLMTD